MDVAGVPFYFNYDAVAVHRGYRSFSSWCASAHVYGQVEVILAARKGQSARMAELSQSYTRKPSILRWMLQMSLGRKKLRGLMVQALRFAAGALSAIGLARVAHYPYSLIFNLQHWNGVAEELGGKDAFMRLANGAMPSILTEERVDGVPPGPSIEPM